MFFLIFYYNGNSNTNEHLSAFIISASFRVAREKCSENDLLQKVLGAGSSARNMSSSLDASMRSQEPNAVAQTSAAKYQSPSGYDFVAKCYRVWHATVKAIIWSTMKKAAFFHSEIHYEIHSGIYYEKWKFGWVYQCLYFWKRPLK